VTQKKQSVDIQYWPSCDNTALDRAPVLPSRHEGENHRSQNVGETGIQRPHDACASRELLLFVIARGGSVDLAGESVERPLERGGVFATLSQSAIELARSWNRLTFQGQKDTMLALVDRSPVWELEFYR
jgi:hypothetical protein